MHTNREVVFLSRTVEWELWSKLKDNIYYLAVVTSVVARHLNFLKRIALLISMQRPGCGHPTFPGSVEVPN